MTYFGGGYNESGRWENLEHFEDKNGQNGEDFKGLSFKRQSKLGIGILLFLLGIIGLIVGLLLYPLPQYEYERKTFIKGWLIGLGVMIGLVVFLMFIGLIVSACS